MSYPNGPLLRVLAERVLANLDHIDAAAPNWAPASPDRDRAPYTDTQLLVSTLGRDYDKQFRLADVMTIIHPKGDGAPIDITDDEGEPVTVDPTTIENLPRLLRNSIAHFNVRPIETDGGRFGGIRVWNKNLDGEITLIADIGFDQLRRLARFVLSAFAKGGQLDGLDDPQDPLQALEDQKSDAAAPKMPKLNRDHLHAALKMHGGDHVQAKTWLDRTLSAALKAGRP